MSGSDSPKPPRDARARGLAWCALIYTLAVLTGGAVLAAAPTASMLGDAGIAMGASGVLVFLFSTALRNVSCFDAWWSVAPIALVSYWTLVPSSGAAAGGNRPRQLLVLALVILWGLRLTWNWARGWAGMHHEDWRYADLRGDIGRLFPVVSLLGLHLMPCLMVWLGCISAGLAIRSAAPLGPLDIVAGAFTLGAIALETAADEELRAARRPGAAPLGTKGLWSISRHPNYLGEMSFWWGLWGIAMAAGSESAWAVIGPVAMTALFMLVSIPIMEKRLRKRRPAYAEYMRRVPMLLPWPRARS